MIKIPGSIIKNIKNTRCGWDNKILDKGTRTNLGHSHKELMKCLYKSNVEIFRSRQTVQAKDQEIKGLQQELAKYLIEEEKKKTKTGLMDVQEPVEIVDEDAKNLLDVESVMQINQEESTDNCG